MVFWKKFLLLFALLFITAKPEKVCAQFYNGHQMDFGKNRVQFEETIWTHFRFEKFDVHLYLSGRPIAEYVARYASKKIPEMERIVEYPLESKIQFVVFNRLSDLMQSNIGLITSESYNVGGITHIVGSKVFLYFSGDYADLDRQINAGIAQVMAHQLFFGEGLTNMLVSAALVNIPEWFEHGLISFLSEGWSVETDNIVRDAFLSGNYRRFNRLTGEQARYAGHSIWFFISEKFGPGAIANIIFMSRASRSIENGFLYVLGITYKELLTQWRDFFLERYRYSEERQDGLPIASRFKTSKGALVYTQARLSPDGRYLAYATDDLGKKKVVLHSLADGKSRTIMKRGYKLDEKTDFSWPVMAWHPSGQFLTLITEEKGGLWIYHYWLDTRKFDKLELFSFEKVLDFTYSPNGQFMLFSAVMTGMTNLYLFYPGANSYEAITSDGFTDMFPRFINGGKEIVFSSNRLSDTLRLQQREVPVEKNEGLNLFVYDFQSRSPVLKRITNTSRARNTQAVEVDNKHLSYIGDENGVRNRYLVSVDSVISRVDTITHYRYIYKSVPVTNFRRNILLQDIAAGGGKYAQVFFEQGKYHLHVDDWNFGAQKMEKELVPTYYAQNRKLEKDRKSQTPESSALTTRRKRLVALPALLGDSMPQIDINNYLFGQVKAADTIKTAVQEPQAFTFPILRNYDVEFSLSELFNQLDFGFLNESYQPFQGGKSPIFINPGLNGLLKVGMMDLLEDYRITGGVRINTSLVNNEYLLSFENLRKRWDRQLVLHRKGVDYNTGSSLVRIQSHEGRYLLRYPFSRVFSARGSVSFRSDKSIYMATDLQNLQKPAEFNFWAGAKAELIFDNTRSPGVNLYYGTRWKAFAENYRQVDDLKKDLWVVGVDFRHYLPVHRNFIWANRFAASTSFGKQLLIYYLGGVDTWLMPRFDRDVETDPSKNYVYQTLATNMRGFYQNVRNGNSFFVYNSELRFPVFSYLLNRPIKNPFVKNFQIVTFADFGSAWTGPHPFSEENSFFTKEIQRPGSPLRVTLITQRNPIVIGYGTGLRTTLLGYLIRADVAWGIDDGVILPRVFYLSLSLDF